MMYCTSLLTVILWHCHRSPVRPYCLCAALLPVRPIACAVLLPVLPYIAWAWNEYGYRTSPSQSAVIPLLIIRSRLKICCIFPTPISFVRHKKKPAIPPGSCCLSRLLPVLPCCRGGVNPAPAPAPVNQLYISLLIL